MSNVRTDAAEAHQHTFLSEADEFENFYILVFRYIRNKLTFIQGQSHKEYTGHPGKEQDWKIYLLQHSMYLST